MSSLARKNRWRTQIMRYTTALLVSTRRNPCTAAPLTVERIFGAPDLSGPRLRDAEVLAGRPLRHVSAG